MDYAIFLFPLSSEGHDREKRVFENPVEKPCFEGCYKDPQGFLLVNLFSQYLQKRGYRRKKAGTDLVNKDKYCLVCDPGYEVP